MTCRGSPYCARFPAAEPLAPLWSPPCHHHCHCHYHHHHCHYHLVIVAASEQDPAPTRLGDARVPVNLPHPVHTLDINVR